MIILDSLLTGGIRFVLDKIATAVDREMNDEGSLREELLAAQMRYELGEIDDDELAEIEGALMERLREVRQARAAEAAGAADGEEGQEQKDAAAGALSFDPRRHTIGVEVAFSGDEEPE